MCRRFGRRSKEKSFGRARLPNHFERFTEEDRVAAPSVHNRYKPPSRGALQTMARQFVECCGPKRQRFRLFSL
jgi:hypothetical protein